MAARVFGPMARVFQRTFKESGVHYWQRHDAAEPDVIQLIFNEAAEAVNSDGVEVFSGVPTAWVAKSELMRLAPGRAALDSSLWVSNRDRLIISGRPYSVGSCRFDGHAMCEIQLVKGSHT